MRPPLRAVWEITRRCTLACTHCLVESGPGQPEGELDTAAALDVCDQLAALGVRKVSLTGGEPLSRPDWHVLAARLRGHGLEVVLSTNGQALKGRQLERAVALGISEVVVSVDGLPESHDRVRRYFEAAAKRSSWREVEAAIARIRAAGIPVSAITAVRRDTLDELPAIHAALKAAGLTAWLVQLAHPTGRFDAADMVPRERMGELARFLAGIVDDPVLPPLVHNTIGWLSKEEPLLRSSGRKAAWPAWRGTPCGRTVIGLEPDGGVKGCPNQVGAPFVVGKLPDEPLAAIWADRARWFWVDQPPDQAQGPCAPCGLKGVCGGGCPCVAYATTGHTFDQPWCLRAIAREGEAPSATPHPGAPT